MAPGFKVIISGGGIAGLTLANALEKADIDYVLLERRDTLTPQVGASIGILPNGCRLIDQLGCAEQLYACVEPIIWMNDRDKNGRPMTKPSDIAQLNVSRFGYDIAFGDRQAILQVFYNNIKDKSKLLTGKNLSLVRHHSSGVTVICDDGTSYTGDVLAGADGVNSKTRSEMWRLADEQDPELVKKDKESLVCQYQCLFGIASQSTGLRIGDMEIGYDKDRSSLVIVGKDDRTYYFAFEKLDKVYKPPHVPVFTTADRDRFAESHGDMKITEKITLKDIHKHALWSHLVGVETATYKIWTWGRIACLGDASHKMTPNAGFGGNAAMESAAALANSIKKMVDVTIDGHPSQEQVVACLESYQKSREIRAGAAIDASNFLTHVQAFATWGHVLFARYGLSILSDFLENLGADMSVGAALLDYLPVPERSLKGNLPFNPEQGEGHKEWYSKRLLLGLPLLALGAYSWRTMASTFHAPALDIAIEAGLGSMGLAKGTIAQYLFGFKALDTWTTRLSGFLLPAAFGNDTIGRPWLLSFATDFGVISAIWSIEAVRRCNALMPVQLPGVFAFLVQMFSASVIAPIYYLIHWAFSPISSFKSTDMRLTNLQRTRAVLPSLLLLYYLPLFASFFWPNISQRIGWLQFWSLFPFWHFVGQKLGSRAFEDTVHHDKMYAPKRDVPAIRHAVGVPIAFSAIAHIYAIFTAPSSLLSLFQPKWQNSTSDHIATIRDYMLWNHILLSASTYLWLAYFTWDATFAGMIKTGWIKMIAIMVLGTVIVGPGAAAGIAWLWREWVITEKRHRAALTVESVRERGLMANGEASKKVDSKIEVEMNGEMDVKPGTEMNGVA